ncbi:MAG: hypothetical protein QM715_09460 [Nibricoccus sp.]
MHLVFERILHRALPRLWACLSLIGTFSATMAAADYRLDPSFAVRLEKTDYWSVNAVANRADGGFYVGGYFSSIGGQHHRSLAKFNADGSSDRNFNPGGGFSGYKDFLNGSGPTVSALAVQNDGRVVAAGDFSYFDGVARSGIVRLNADGSLDQTFNPAGGFWERVTTLAIQADGKILVGGLFTSFNQTPCGHIVRLNSDGSRDSTFNPGSGFNSNVYSIVVQPDGRILVGGSFYSVNGTEQKCIARLNSDGSRDISFSTGLGFDWRVSSLALQPDGRIVAAGWFSTFNGAAVNCIARLHSNGSLDTTFNPGTGFNGEVYRIALQADGKIVAAGGFTTYNGILNNEIVRLNADGSIDTTFHTGTGLQHRASTAAATVLTDGKIVAVGGFTLYNGISANGVVRLLADGSFEQTPSGSPLVPAKVQTAYPMAGGKWFVGGDFNFVNGIARDGVAVLNANGSVDTGFDSGTGLDGFGCVYAALPQADGGWVVGGFIWSYNGTECDNVIRLLPNGALDTRFSTSNVSRGNVYALAQQSDGKILAGGEIPSSSSGGGSVVIIGPQPPRGAFLSRLQTDGSLDGSFTALTAIQSNGFLSWVDALALKADGKIFVGGAFVSSSSPSSPSLLRLNPSGSVDSTFSAGIEANRLVNAIAIQPDGRLVLGGRSVNYSDQLTLARLNADGSADPTFSTSALFDNIITSVALQPDGKIVVGGHFRSVNTAARNSLARLNSDGTFDTGFAAPDITTDAVTSVSVLQDGRLLVSGPTAYRNGVLQAGLVVLKEEPAPTPSPNPTDNNKPSSGGGGASSPWLLMTLSATALFRLIRGCRQRSRLDVPNC